MIPLPQYCLPTWSQSAQTYSHWTHWMCICSFICLLIIPFGRPIILRTEIFLHPLCLVRELAQYWHLISICMLRKFILRLFFKCCFHFFAFSTEQIASAIYCALQASISIEQSIPFSLYVARKQSFRPLLSVSSYWQSSLLSSLGLAWIIVGWVNYAYGYYTGEPRMWKQAAMSFITLTGLRGPSSGLRGFITLAGLMAWSPLLACVLCLPASWLG